MTWWVVVCVVVAWVVVAALLVLGLGKGLRIAEIRDRRRRDGALSRPLGEGTHAPPEGRSSAGGGTAA